MKSIINKILVLISAVIFLIASVGVNVFSHFCSHCHVSYYSVDVTPIEEECQCEHDCTCSCHCHKSGESEHKCCGHSNKHKCGMHSHEHEFYHIDDSYNTPEKTYTNNIILIAFLFKYLGSFDTTGDTYPRYPIIKERPFEPDLIRLNCTMLC